MTSVPYSPLEIQPENYTSAVACICSRFNITRRSIWISICFFSATLLMYVYYDEQVITDNRVLNALYHRYRPKDPLNVKIPLRYYPLDSRIIMDLADNCIEYF